MIQLGLLIAAAVFLADCVSRRDNPSPSPAQPTPTGSPTPTPLQTEAIHNAQCDNSGEIPNRAVLHDVRGAWETLQSFMTPVAGRSHSLFSAMNDSNGNVQLLRAQAGQVLSAPPLQEVLPMLLGRPCIYGDDESDAGNLLLLHSFLEFQGRQSGFDSPQYQCILVRATFPPHPHENGQTRSHTELLTEGTLRFLHSRMRTPGAWEGFLQSLKDLNPGLGVTPSEAYPEGIRVSRCALRQ